MSSEVVERFLKAREEGDVDACAALVAERAIWHSPVGDDLHGPAGVPRGARAGLRRDGVVRDRDARRARTTRALVAARIRNRGERDGEELDSIQLLVFQVADGRIVDVRIHVDDPAAVEEFWAG